MVCDQQGSFYLFKLNIYYFKTIKAIYLPVRQFKHSLIVDYQLNVESNKDYLYYLGEYFLWWHNIYES